VKPNINSVEVHPQLNTNGHPVDGALVRWWALVQPDFWFADFWFFVLRSCRNRVQHDRQVRKSLVV
jgi:hypothetical protein